MTQTGDALSVIQSQVTQINDHVHSIAIAAGEQTTGLSEINTAVNQMDQVTQQNAAMVEEATASTSRLAEEVVTLAGLISRFKVETKAAVPPISSEWASIICPLPLRYVQLIGWRTPPADEVLLCRMLRDRLSSVTTFAVT